MKTYSVKEVREITGLSWKQLYEFKDGIPGDEPINDAGYKQYTREDLEKLLQAALMVKLGAKPKDINEAFADENYDRKKVLTELNDRAQKQLIEAQDVVTVTEALLEYSNDNALELNLFAIRDLHAFAEDIRSAQNDEDRRLLENYFKKKKNDEFTDKIVKFLYLDESDIRTEKPYSLVSDLKEFAEETIGMNGNRFLALLHDIFKSGYHDEKAYEKELDLLRTSFEAGHYDEKALEKVFAEKKKATISKAIEMYMIDGFMKESLDEIAELLEYIEFEVYDEEYVKTCIDSIVQSFMKHFGLKTKFEFLSAAESYRFEVMTNDYMSDKQRKEMIEEIDYIVGAVLHYEAQKDS